jgi:hypothetical protein
MSRRIPRAVRVAAAPALAAVALLAPSPAHAGLSVLRPTPASPATFYGHGGFSTDGVAPDGVPVRPQSATAACALAAALPGCGGGLASALEAEVPAGSQVEQAYLYGTYNTAPSNEIARTFDFDGTNVVLDEIYTATNGSTFTTVRGDVTAQVADKVGSGGAITSFPVVHYGADSLDGLALVVIYSNPDSPEVTIAVLEGGAAVSGDTTTFGFASPLNTSAAALHAKMALGIGFSYQPGSTPHACGGGQASIVDVNDERLTSCAGGQDDGGDNGGLITVGGVGDFMDNPSPLATTTGDDDELYDLTPFLRNGDTSLTIDTANPSQDDNVFVAVVEVTARAGVGSGGEAPPAPPADPDPAPAAQLPLLAGTPPVLTNATTTTLQFAAPDGDDGTVGFECDLDDAGWAACAPGDVLEDLAEGPHTLKVRGVNADALSGPAATYTWTVDTTNPVAPPVTAPQDAGDDSVAIPLTGEDGAAFECALDDERFAACASPFTTSGLAAGAHTLRVRQRDAAGNTGTVSTVTWTVAAAAVAPTPEPQAARPVAATCVSRRSFRVHWRVPAGVNLRRIVARIDGRRVATLLGSARRMTVDLRGTPKRTVKLTITGTTAKGERLATSRVYRTCAATAPTRIASLSLKPVRS